MLLEKIIKDNFILVCYDFDADNQGNVQRTMMRNELTGKPFYAKMMTQSVYYLPESFGSLETVRKWAKSKKANIVVFGNVDATDVDKTRMAKQYYRFLKDLVREMKDILIDITDDLNEFEDNIEDPDVTLRGFHAKVSGIKNRFEDLRKSVNRVGDKEDDLNLEMIASHVKTLERRYETAKSMKEKIKEKKS